MKIKEIIDALSDKAYELLRENDRLLDATCADEVLPEGFSNWEQVECAIANINAEIDDLQNAINSLNKWRNNN